MKIDLTCPSCKHSLHIEAEVTFSGAVVDKTVNPHYRKVQSSPSRNRDVISVGKLEDFGLNHRWARLLHAHHNKLFTIEQLIDYLDSGHSLADLYMIGRTGASRIVDALNAYIEAGG